MLKKKEKQKFFFSPFILSNYSLPMFNNEDDELELNFEDYNDPYDEQGEFISVQTDANDPLCQDEHEKSTDVQGINPYNGATVTFRRGIDASAKTYLQSFQQPAKQVIFTPRDGDLQAKFKKRRKYLEQKKKRFGRGPAIRNETFTTTDKNGAIIDVPRKGNLFEMLTCQIAEWYDKDTMETPKYLKIRRDFKKEPPKIAKRLKTFKKLADISTKTDPLSPNYTQRVWVDLNHIYIAEVMANKINGRNNELLQQIAELKVLQDTKDPALRRKLAEITCAVSELQANMKSLGVGADFKQDRFKDILAQKRIDAISNITQYRELVHHDRQFCTDFDDLELESMEEEIQWLNDVERKAKKWAAHDNRSFSVNQIKKMVNPRVMKVLSKAEFSNLMKLAKGPRTKALGRSRAQVCYLCGKPGHKKKNCPKRKANPASGQADTAKKEEVGNDF